MNTKLEDYLNFKIIQLITYKKKNELVNYSNLGRNMFNSYLIISYGIQCTYTYNMQK